MKPLLYTGAGFMLALLFVYCLTVAYDRGMTQVVSDCKFYGKHATDGTGRECQTATLRKQVPVHGPLIS